VSDKHTGGEWYAEDRGERIVILSNECDYEVAELVVDQSGACSRHDEEMDENAAADAALITASPNMLRALEQVERLISEALPRFDWGRSALDANAIRLLNETPGVVAAALAKARGK
jgi:hypothetical protein